MRSLGLRQKERFCGVQFGKRSGGTREKPGSEKRGKSSQSAEQWLMQKETPNSLRGPNATGRAPGVSPPGWDGVAML